MPLAKKQVRVLAGVGLVLATLALRLPFMAKTLFEFDSVAFAVATFRFSLEQVTPHMPGYILHVVLGRFFLLFTPDHNTAFVLLSILMSVLSVLCIWRAGAWLRGERLGVIAAFIWMTTPMFWFYSVVATSYIHEAFFASLLLYLGLRRLKDARNEKLLYYIVITLSLAAAARQSSFLLFLPAVIYIFRSSCWSWKTLFVSVGLFIAVTACWVLILFSESGGSSSYFAALKGESIYRSQSVLFGNTIQEHLTIIGKLIFYLLIGSVPFIILGFWTFMRFPAVLITLYKTSMSKRSARFVLLIALPALIFYALVYFMKAGYILNILPSLCLVSSVLLDQLAIWYAETKRMHSQDSILFTSILITKRTIVFVCCITLVNGIWFVIPLPGKDTTITNDLYTKESILGSAETKYALSRNGVEYLLNKAFAYSSLFGIRSIDEVNSLAIDIINKEKKYASVVILDSWWVRFSYYYMPDVLTYNIRSIGGDTLSGIYKQYEFVLTRNVSKTEVLPKNSRVLILIRDDHPDFQLLLKQVSLVSLSRNSTLGLYRIEDTTFTLHWKDYTFTNE